MFGLIEFIISMIDINYKIISGPFQHPAALLAWDYTNIVSDVTVAGAGAAEISWDSSTRNCEMGFLCPNASPSALRCIGFRICQPPTLRKMWPSHHQCRYEGAPAGGKDGKYVGQFSKACRRWQNWPNIMHSLDVSIVTGASNEGSRRFQNLGEGPF